ncbi:MAG: ATPase P [Oscillospiraceae bacterium]|nr:ATPase P [Oscillospiraceae bacterium]
MIVTPKPLGGKTLPREVLEADKTNCLKFGPCGVGKEALYLGGRYIDRCFYLPWREVKRVFKRVAMSSGGFTGKGVFGSLAFLVVQYSGGKERECPFKLEGDVDRLLAAVERAHPDIPTHSKAAAKKLAAAEAAEQARYRKELSPTADAAVAALRDAQDYLEQRSSLTELLVAAAKQKRVIDNLKPSVRVIGALCAVLGIALALWGAVGLLTQRAYAVYFLIGGAALFLFTLSSNTLPSKWNSRAKAQADWDEALAAMRDDLSECADFPVPPQYAHPIVLERMQRVLREGRAEDAAQALAVVKDDLRALNASVTVSQREHDEVVTVKPLFLVCDYQ